MLFLYIFDLVTLSWCKFNCNINPFWLSTCCVRVNNIPSLSHFIHKRLLHSWGYLKAICSKYTLLYKLHSEEKVGLCLMWSVGSQLQIFTLMLFTADVAVFREARTPYILHMMRIYIIEAYKHSISYVKGWKVRLARVSSFPVSM